MNNSKLSFKKLFVKMNLAYHGNTLRYLKQIQRWQWLDNRQSYTLQKDRLRNLLMHAYHHVPYYRETLANAGVVNDPRAVNLKSFEQIPLLEKGTIRSRFEDLKSDDLPKRKWHKNASGGSTGEPVTLIQDKHYDDWVRASTMLNDIWSGYSISERKILLWGSERDIFVGKETVKTRIIQWFMNQTWLNAFRMTHEDMCIFVNKINDLKPIQILAYAESISELSRFIERERLRIHFPRAIMTSAGTLFPHMRKTIERVFQAPVFDRYGSREVAGIACECEHHTGLHVCAPNHYVEVIKADGSSAGPGELGEIVITCLNNFAMPLIRYRIGDMGMWATQACSCGRGWPLLKEIVGRVTDIFFTNNGSRIHGEYFTHLFYYQDWIKKFQVIQENLQFLRIRIVPREWAANLHQLYEKEIKMIIEKIILVMGQDTKMEFEFVKDIAPTASGKYRYTISKLTK